MFRQHCTGQQIAPSTQPRPAHFIPDVLWRRLCFDFRVPPGTPQFPLTTCHRPQHPTRRGVAPSLTHQLGAGSLPPPSVRRPPASRPVPLQRGHHGGVDGQLGAVEDGQTIRLASTGLPPSMSRFLTMTFVDTRPPPSLHTRARSSANPLAPRTPASAHAARWWPRQSRRRPHRQVREDKGRGRWRRRHNNTRKGCGSIRVDQDAGNAIRTLLARGPLCDRESAFWRTPQCFLGYTRLFG